MQTLPRQADLDRLLSQAHRITLLDGGESGGVRLSDTRLLTVEPPLLAELTELLAIDEHGPHAICMCLGDYALEIADSAGSVLAVIGLHHRVTLRWTQWEYDAVLRRPTELVTWLAGQGVPQLAAEEAAEEERRAARQRLEAAWAAAAPPALHDLLNGLVQRWSREGRSPQADVEAVAQHLATAYSSSHERITATLRWYGAGPVAHPATPCTRKSPAWCCCASRPRT